VAIQEGGKKLTERKTDRIFQVSTKEKVQKERRRPMLVTNPTRKEKGKLRIPRTRSLECSKRNQWRADLLQRKKKSSAKEGGEYVFLTMRGEGSSPLSGQGETLGEKISPTYMQEGRRPIRRKAGGNTAGCQKQRLIV